MTEERIQTLNDVGFNWRGTATTGAAALWNERFQQLKDYKERFGDCLVPRQYAANPKLGRWVSTQRCNYKLHQEGKPSSMTEERIRALEDPRIGFKWKLYNVT